MRREVGRALVPHAAARGSLLQFGAPRGKAVERREGACAPPPEGSAGGMVPEGGRERERARRGVKKKNIILTYGSRFDGWYRLKI